MRYVGTTISIIILCLMISCGRSGNQPAEGFWWPEEPVSASEKRQETETKLSRLHDFMHRENVGGLLIGRAENIAWVSAGGDGGGEALLFLREDGRKFLIADDGRTKRLLAEDLKGLGCEARAVQWYRGGRESSGVLAAVAEASGGREFASDIPFSGARQLEQDIRGLRSPLTAPEIAKYRWLGKTCAQTMNEVGLRLSPGMTERGIEALVSSALARHAIYPVRIRVATDARVSRFSNAPPSDDAKLERFVRIGIHARRWGMDVALTRCIYFGTLPDEVQRELKAVATVCAGFWARTLPGAAAEAVLQDAIADYATAGFPDAWEASDQGGAIGYGGWDWVALPDSGERALAGQVFAWHPEVHGVRMEDTILLLGENLEVLTEIDGWPAIEAKSLGRIYRLPAILIR